MMYWIVQTNIVMSDFKYYVEIILTTIHVCSRSDVKIYLLLPSHHLCIHQNYLDTHLFKNVKMRLKKQIFAKKDKIKHHRRNHFSHLDIIRYFYTLHIFFQKMQRG